MEGAGNPPNFPFDLPFNLTLSTAAVHPLLPLPSGRLTKHGTLQRRHGSNSAPTQGFKP